MSSEVERSATRVRGFDDPEMDFQLIRMLGMAPYGGAALGECLTAARQIAGGNPWSRARAFGEPAVRLQAQAWDCSRAGHRVSARELFPRTSHYCRAAAHEPRLRALIPTSPIVDLCRYMVAFLGYGAVKAEDDLAPDEMAALPDGVVPAAAKWGLFNVCRRFGVPRLGAFFEVLKRFRVGPALQNITGPTLALVGEGEGAESLAQAREYRAGVAGPRQLSRFTVADGADTHGQLNNLSSSNHAILDGLDDRFA
jgi:hypothetical protein